MKQLVKFFVGNKRALFSHSCVEKFSVKKRGDRFPILFCGIFFLKNSPFFVDPPIFLRFTLCYLSRMFLMMSSMIPLSWGLVLIRFSTCFKVYTMVV